MKRVSFALTIAACLGLAIAAEAGKPSGFQVKPWVYDPFDLGTAESEWVTHEGLPDAGNSNHALYLQKFDVTSAWVAAGATVAGVEGITLNELGFDVRNDSHFGAGAPRFNVVMANGDMYFFGAAYGTHTAIGTDWTRVRFSAADAFPTSPPFAFGEVKSIEIVFDEGTDAGDGYAFVDNIDINGVLIGKPGNAK